MFGPHQRARIARWAMFVSIPLCPISMLTWAKGEPPTTLGLSWVALIICLADVAATTDVREQSETDTPATTKSDDAS